MVQAVEMAAMVPEPTAMVAEAEVVRVEPEERPPGR
jgi:hypothetical protein